MTNLRLHPQYTHNNQKSAPETNLTWETAAPIYQKLKNFLIISKDSLCPAEGWKGSDTDRRDLFTHNGFHHRVRWSSKLSHQYRRLNFDEFCIWYGIKC